MQSKNYYWNWRFKKGEIYSSIESSIMPKIVGCFSRSKKIIVVGGGHGRNAAFLAKRKFAVTNTDISRVAIELGKEIFKKTKNLKFSILDILKKQIRFIRKYDSILCIYLLSLFKEKELHIVFQNLKKLSNNKGFIVLNFLSTKDGEYGSGKKIGKNEFLFHKEQYIKFYTKNDVTKILAKEGFKIKNIFKYKEKRYINILNKNIMTVSWVAVLKIPKYRS